MQLSYTFDSTEQRGADLENPLFELLAALSEGGSIKRAASLLGVSYRHAWGLVHHWEGVLGEPLVVWSQGQPARLTVLAQRLLWEERRARTRVQPHLETLRSDLERLFAREPRRELLSVCASNDLALPVLQQHLAGVAGVHLDIGFAGSADSVKALAEEKCLIAGFHVPPEATATEGFAPWLRPWLAPLTHCLIPCMRRVQGLMLRQEHAGMVRSLADVVRLQLRFVSRQPGSGTRMLQDHLADSQGLPAGSLGGDALLTERTHVAVALCVASGVADAGLGIKAAALQLGLHFVPLIEEDYFLACATSSLSHPGVERLREALAGEPWRRIVARLPGYLPVGAPGSVQPVGRVFPEKATSP